MYRPFRRDGPKQNIMLMWSILVNVMPLNGVTFRQCHNIVALYTNYDQILTQTGNIRASVPREIFLSQTGIPVRILRMVAPAIFLPELRHIRRKLRFEWDIDLHLQQPLPIKSVVEAVFHHPLRPIIHTPQPTSGILH
mmetsp:Transcript_36422/g.78640  ORF Transcript_36422/g.78640 Transcript_36422/m.78640 type:complete len:138 (-) Transcript_36422:921-1334(-)